MDRVPELAVAVLTPASPPPLVFTVQFPAREPDSKSSLNKISPGAAAAVAVHINSVARIPAFTLESGHFCPYLAVPLVYRFENIGPIIQ
jgi:hypothetical protein